MHRFDCFGFAKIFTEVFRFLKFDCNEVVLVNYMEGIAECDGLYWCVHLVVGINDQENLWSNVFYHYDSENNLFRSSNLFYYSSM
jgi:hypothetical protein